MMTGGPFQDDDGDNQFFASEELEGRIPHDSEFNADDYENILSVVIVYHDRPFIAPLRSFKRRSKEIDIEVETSISEAMNEIKDLSAYKSPVLVKLLELHRGDNVEYAMDNLTILEYGIHSVDIKRGTARFTLMLDRPWRLPHEPIED